MSKEELKVTVPMTEVLELQRLVGKIENPTAYYRENTLKMSNDVIRESIAYAESIGEILYKWTQGNETL